LQQRVDAELEMRRRQQRVEFASYRSDPATFVQDVLGTKLWDREAEILEAVRDHPKVAVVKANSIGGTFTAARVVLWWLNSFAPSKVVTTAPPPDRQIKDLLWGELRAAQRKALSRGMGLVGGEPLIMKLGISDEHWAQGFTIPLSGTKEDRIARFQGHHSPHLLFIFDEAHAIPEEIWEAADSCMSGGHWRFLILSNPLAPNGPFYQRVRGGGWHVIEISALEHPNVVAGENVIPGCVDRAKTVERIQRWSEVVDNPTADCFQVPDFLDGEQTIVEKPPLEGGEWRIPTNPLLSTKTLGKFPTIGGGLIPLAWVQRANVLWYEREGKGEGDLALGVDPAGLGENLTAVAFERGKTVEKIETLAKADPMAGAGYVKAQLMRQSSGGTEAPIGAAKIEADGIGVGMIARLREQDVPVISVQAGGGAKGSDGKDLTDVSGELTFRYLRDYLWYALRDELEAGEYALPPDDDLTEEITAVMPDGYTSSGKFKLESKDRLKKRIGRSPDKGDSVAMLFAPAEKPPVRPAQAQKEISIEEYRRAGRASRLDRRRGRTR